MWNIASQSIVTITDGKVGTKALRMADTSFPNQGSYVPIDPLKKYRVKFWARPVAATNGLLYFCLQQFTDDTGATCAVNGGRSPYKPSGHSRATHNALFGTDAWGEYNYVWSESDFQAGVKFVRPDLLGNYSGTAGYWEVQGFSFIDATDAELNTAAIQTEATTRVTDDNKLFAQYTVKVDTNGYVSGFGLANTLKDAVPFSEFTIKADQFTIAPVNTDNTAADGSPFFYRTAATTINGVSVPAGAYMKSAYIHDATITTAKIADLAVDNAKIASLSAAKITAGAIGVGSYIQSTAFTSGSAGWKINADGTAELANAVVRGTVYATAGQIGGITIASNAVRAGQTAYDTGTGFYLGSDGKFSIGNSAGAKLTWNGTTLGVVGDITGSSGTFTGSITGASGTFGGNVHAGQFTTGAMTMGDWPTTYADATKYGTYLGPQGLLIGNYYNNKYFYVKPTGDIYAPGFTVVGGVLSISQANVINTLNIANEQVTVPRGNALLSTVTYMTIGELISVSITTHGKPVFIASSANCTDSSVGWVELRRDGATLLQQSVAPGPISMSFFDDAPSANAHLYQLYFNGFGSSNTFTNRSIFVMETQR
jgi:hypothetical protein